MTSNGTLNVIETPVINGSEGRLEDISTHPAGTYKVISVQPTTTPDGLAGDSWHEYLIGDGGAVITGCRRGSQREVTEHAQEFAERLNIRRHSKGGSLWTPRKKS